MGEVPSAVRRYREIPAGVREKLQARMERLDYDEMVRTLNTRIHQFAKRQDTWFRRMERRGVTIHWIPGGDYVGLRSLVNREMGPGKQEGR